uniref:Mpv17-like protein 2 n=2 Tax=Hirondellea gigas TaxID=1518452 RepID=A0A6A7G3A5_9CRUS
MRGTKLPHTLNVLKAFWRGCFAPKNLLLTNTVSSGILLGVGDCIQQKIERWRGVHTYPHYDWARTGRLFTVGLIAGPPHHFFYIFLDKFYPRTDAKTVFKKIMIDQIIAAPFFAFIFFTGTGLLEGKMWKDCLEEFKQKFPAVYLFDWCLWPPSQAINFMWVPSQYRVLYVNAVTVIWDVFLSYTKHYDQEAKVGKMVAPGKHGTGDEVPAAAEIKKLT